MGGGRESERGESEREREVTVNGIIIRAPPAQPIESTRPIESLLAQSR